MKILLSHRYFWPDTSPYATILRSIAARFADEGHDVSVFSTQPSYHASTSTKAPSRETIDGFQVIRMPIAKERKNNLPLRGFNVVAYAYGLRRHILKTGDYDLVMAATFPPIAAASVAASAAHRIGAKFIYHFMDLHPEVSLYAGQLQRGRIFNGLQTLDARTCRKADALVLLSDDMATTLKERPGNAHLKPHIINNFLLENFEQVQTPDAPQLRRDRFTILFAGNMGKFQNLDNVIAAAHKLTDLENVHFWFMGKGVEKAHLIKQAGALLDKTVFFLPFQHHSVAQKLMGDANLNLVSLAPDIYRVAYPSKTLAILAQGAPILATIEAASELGRMVVDEEIGFTADQTDPSAIAGVVRKAYMDRAQESKLRENAEQLYNTRFAKDKILDRWCNLINQMKS